MDKIMERWSSLKFAAIAIIIWHGQFGAIEGGAITNYVLDENCPLDIEIHEIRISDCDELPCTIRRGKRYYVEGDFSVLRNVSKIVLKCSTVYLGRHFELPGHGGCDNLTNGTCPVETGQVYTSSTSFKIPYYVPRMTYTVKCSMVDDVDEPMMCGWGSGKVV